MGRYILKRFAFSLVTIWILATLVFILIRLLPGDPFRDAKMPIEIKERMMEYYGLNDPWYQQYGIYMNNLAHGDLGYSLRYKNRKVNDILMDAFPYSAELGVRAIVFALSVGLVLGIVAALNHNGKWDYLTVGIAIIGISVPSFIVAGLMQYGFSVQLKLLPVARWESEAHKVLPTIALGLGTLALITRMMRTSMLENISMDYIKMARAKGLSQFQITWGHQIRNAILPVVTIMGPTIAALLTGTFVIENIFAIPGLGRHYVLSIQNLDYTMVAGLTIFYGVFLVFMLFLVDVVYGFVDPRIRVTGKAR